MRTQFSQVVAASLCEAPVFAQDAGWARILPRRRPEGGGYSSGKEQA